MIHQFGREAANGVAVVALHTNIYILSNEKGFRGSTKLYRV